MRIPRAYLDLPLAAGVEVTLDGQIHHHLVQVLRLKPGAPLILFNGLGGEYTATLSHVTRRVSSAIVDAFVEVDRESPVHIALLQGVAKGARMDYILQKTVELGVRSIQPVLTRYSAASQPDWRNKMAHWKGVVIGACEQSGRTRVPELGSPSSLQASLALDDTVLALALDPQAERGLCDLPRPSRAAVLIGPEGGLDGDELMEAERHGFRRVRIGPRILRTETAAVAALTAAQLLWGDLDPG